MFTIEYALTISESIVIVKSEVMADFMMLARLIGLNKDAIRSLYSIGYDLLIFY